MYNNVRTNLIPGRAGEIVNEANPLTFSLLQKIFESGGPFRETLKVFGIKTSQKQGSYIELVKGKVLTDLDQENEMIWTSLPLRYELQNGKVVQKFYFDPLKIFNLLIKSLHETKYLADVNGTEETVFSKYKHFSEFAEDVYKNRFVTTPKFLEAYKDVVFISYIYELFFSFNDTDKEDIHPATQKKLSAYTAENDYLLRREENFAENVFKIPNDFWLGQPAENKTVELPLIPSKLPKLDLDDKTGGRLKLETELQCIKNDLRLKTGLVLYFLNIHLWEKARQKGLTFIEDRTVDELED